MKVSIALHTADPGEDGNQRTHEAKYMNYNRIIVPMHFDDEGNGIVDVMDMAFPPSGENEQSWAPQRFTHISVAACVGPLGSGGSIIISGPIDGELSASFMGDVPYVRRYLVGVYAARIKAMLEDGRIPTLEDEWRPN